MNTKMACFNENEEKALEFVDKHWDRVMEFGYKDGEGWWVEYSITSKVSSNAVRTTAKATSSK